MRHMVRIALAVMVASLLTGVTLRADDDELRIRRRQLVITGAMADCGAGTLIATGMNFGSQPPHVTLALTELLNVTPPIEGVFQADLPASFCNDPGPGSYLLTVMRTRMRHRHRWLKHTKKDLALFEVAIGVATLDDVTGLQSQIDENADDIATNAADIATNVGAIGTNAGDITTNAGGITTNAGGITTNAGGITTNAADITTNAGDIATNAGNIATNAADIAALGGGGGGGGLEGHEVVSKTYDQTAATIIKPFANSNGFNMGPVLSATCPAGKVVLGGAAKLSGGFSGDGFGHPLFISGQRPFGTGAPVVYNAWIAELFNPGTMRRFPAITVFAICATVAAP